jgi:hypothetical protein
VNPINVPDQGFEFLLNEGNWVQIEETLTKDDPKHFYIRLGKIFNYITNIITFT